MIKKILPLAFVFIAIQGLSQQYFPDGEWQTRQPSEVRMKKDVIDSAIRFALANEVKIDKDLRIANMKAYVNEPDYKIIGPMRDRGKPTGLIIKNGYVIAKWGDPDRVDMTFSVTKSYLSTIAGLGIDQGLLKSIDEPVNKYVWDDKFESPHNRKITWRHLLTQSSDWSGCLFGLCDWADRPPREGSIDDWKSRKLNEPGTVYEYNDVRVNLLSYALLQVWRKPLPQVLKEKIMDPIGASTTWRWYGYENSYVNLDGQMMQSVSGGGHHGGGIFINTWDQARFGLLFCRKGKWKGKQLVSEQWTQMAGEPSKAFPRYGLMWWTNAENDLPGLSKKAYYANGFGGNYIVVDEEHDMIIVIRWMDTNKLGEFVTLVSGALETK